MKQRPKFYAAVQQHPLCIAYFLQRKHN